MSVSQRKAQIEKYVAGVWNGVDPAGWQQEGGTPDFTLNCPFGALQDQEFHGYVKGVGVGFPDAHFQIDELIVEGDLGAFMWTMTGTNTGEFLGRPATGKQVRLPGTSTIRFRDDKISEAWSRWDRVHLMEQLGQAGP